MKNRNDSSVAVDAHGMLDRLNPFRVYDFDCSDEDKLRLKSYLSNNWVRDEVIVMNVYEILHTSEQIEEEGPGGSEELFAVKFTDTLLSDVIKA